MGPWTVTEIKDLVAVIGGASSFGGVVFAAFSARGRLKRRQSALSELLDRRDLAPAARNALVKRRDEVIAKIIAADYVSPVHLLLVACVPLVLLALLAASAHNAGATSNVAELRDIEGKGTWVPPALFPAVVVPCAIGLTWVLHLLSERSRIQSEILQGNVPDTRPAPRNQDLYVWAFSFGLPIFTIGLFAVIGWSPQSALPKLVSPSILIVGLFLTYLGLKPFVQRLPAHLREGPFNPTFVSRQPAKPRDSRDDQEGTDV